VNANELRTNARENEDEGECREENARARDRTRMKANRREKL